MEYRFSKQRPEIVKSLEQNLKIGSKLLVWQKNDDGSRRFLQNMSFCALYPEEGIFTLKVIEGNEQDVDPKKEIFFYVEEENFIFKTKMAIVQKSIMTLQIPREVRLKEFRVHERQYFTLEDKKFVDVTFSLKEEYGQIIVTCPMINISQSGTCIIISKETLAKIDFSININLKFPNEGQKAVIRNARLFMKRTLIHDELFAVGVEFQ